MVIFGLAETVHASGFLAVYLAGLVVGNQPTRAHNTIVVFLDATTWLAQIAMFVMFGLLAWPERLPEQRAPALAVALTLMLIARPASVFLCLAPFRFSLREKLFISWVGLRGAVGIFLASIPLLVGLPNAQIYFDVAFIVVLVSLMVQGWTIASAARKLLMKRRRAAICPPRFELDLPGQLAQELVGYAVGRAAPICARHRAVLGQARRWWCARAHADTGRGGDVHEGDYVYLLAPPEKAPVARPLLRRHAAARVARSAAARRFFHRPGTPRLARLPKFTACRSSPTNRP